MSKTRSPRRPRTTNPALTGFSQRIGHALAAGLAHGAGGETADHAALVVERAPSSIAPARLASAHAASAEMREPLRAVYENCLATYRTSVRPQDAASGIDDAGAAFAFFVAANLHGLQGVDVTAEILARLERQLAALPHLRATWLAASTAERQFLFEQMATVGVVVVGMAARAQAEGDAAIAHVKGAAREHLRQVLGLNPDHITLGPDGLTTRPAQLQVGPAGPSVATAAPATVH